MVKKELYKQLFANYNLTIQKACEEGLMYVKSPRQYETLINMARIKFEKQLFENKLPITYFKAITSIEELMTVFEIANEICDEFIPISFVDAVLRLQGTSKIEQFAFEEFDMEIKATAIRVLGEIKSVYHVQPLIDEIYKTKEELIKEIARQALIDIGDESISIISEKLENSDLLHGDDYHLLIALVKIDENHKNDAIYQLLKQCFLKADDMGIASRCLVDYGNKNAVTFLRGYLSRNLEKLDDTTTLDIRSSIVSLGGTEYDI